MQGWEYMSVDSMNAGLLIRGPEMVATKHQCTAEKGESLSTTYLCHFWSQFYHVILLQKPIELHISYTSNSTAMKIESWLTQGCDSASPDQRRQNSVAESEERTARVKRGRIISLSATAGYQTDSELLQVKAPLFPTAGPHTGGTAEKNQHRMQSQELSSMSYNSKHQHTD